MAIMKIKISLISTLASLTISSFVLGCNNDDADDNKLSSLSADELVDLCEEITLTPAQARGFYTLSCLIDISESGQCNDDDLDDCVALAEASGEAPLSCDRPSEDELASLKQCDATVEEYTQCLRDAAEAFSAFEGLDCSALDNPPQTAEPASCIALNEKCPGLDDDTGEN